MKHRIFMSNFADFQTGSVAVQALQIINTNNYTNITELYLETGVTENSFLKRTLLFKSQSNKGTY